MNEVNVAEVGVPWTTQDRIRDGLTAPGHEPEDDVVLEAPDGSIGGYSTMWRDEPLTTISPFVFVRPALRGHGLSAWLLRFGEDRARARSELTATPIRFQVARWAGNAAAGRLFDALGFRYVRTFHEIRIDLDDGSEQPSLPDGILIRTFQPGHDERPVHAALSEAFRDHWGSNFDPFDVWKHDNIEAEGAGFDASFWFVALEGDEVVGVACCRAGSASAPDAARVDELGVRRAWRHRGIGRALLLRAFAEARRRSIAAVELNVDSESPTGATRLYEGVGMRAIRSFERWEKIIEP